MVHDTLVELCADHFNANDTDTAKQLVYECDEVQKLGLRQGRRRQGPNRGKNNIEDILCALHKCTKGLPIFAVSDLSTLPQLDINDIDFGYILSTGGSRGGVAGVATPPLIKKKSVHP